MGDFNATFDNSIDHSQKSQVTELPKDFKDFVESLQLVDIWWKDTPTIRDCTFFSSILFFFKNTVDFIWASNSLARNMCIAKVNDQSWSDHAFVSAQWRFKVDHFKIRRWRLYNYLLEAPGAKDRQQNDILEFYGWNNGTASSTLV